MPVYQNFLYYSAAEAQNCVRGNVSLVFCNSCGFIFNAEYDSKLLEYSDNYDNTQSYSPLFTNYLRNLGSYLIDKYSLKKKRIIEIGCGKGHFLKMLCNQGQNRGIGIDPSFIESEEFLDDSIIYIKKYFDKSIIDKNVDFFCCRHVLEHLDDPISFLSSIRDAIDIKKDPKLFFEVPSTRWILRNFTFWDFFYEHCNYFDEISLHYAFNKTNFSINMITPAFDEQYLWIEAKLLGENDKIIEEKASSVREIESEVKIFKNNLSQNIKKRQALLEDISSKGKCVVWGAAAKGVMLLNTIDPDMKYIDFVIDINPNKQNKFVAGTGHKIFAPDILKKVKVAGILITNPNYESEIRQLLKDMSIVVPTTSL